MELRPRPRTNARPPVASARLWVRPLGAPPAFRLTGVKRLYLLRHAKSSWSDPSLADMDRPLARRGRKAAMKMAKEFRRREIRPQLVLCSSSRRTQETLELIGSSLGDPTIEVVEGLYGAGSDGCSRECVR